MKTVSEDIVGTLLAQHEQVKFLFGQLETSTGEHRRELFQELVGLLAVHENVEEMIVHPVARQEVPGGENVVSRRLAEEQDAKAALARLYDMGLDDPRFDQELASLRDAVTAHAEAEEELEFLPLREMIDPQRLKQMTVAMKAAAAVAPTRPHPGVAPTPLANILVGPPLAVFDRVRDMLNAATSGHDSTDES